MDGIEPGRTPAAPRDAATVIVLRDEPQGFSVFMVRRHAKSGFMAGAYVFPGGVLDEADATASVLERVQGIDGAEAARRLGEEDATRSLALHVAALRETFEEAGVWLGRAPEAAALEAARGRLVRNEIAFEALLTQLDGQLSADALTPLARWITPEVEPRRYDARFFLARAPEAQRAAHDRVEVTAGEWLTPAEALERGGRGEIQLPPPTLRTLENLAPFATTDEVITHAAARRPPLVDPVFRTTTDSWALVLPGDPEHPRAERALDGPTRFVLVDGVFRSVDP